MSARRRIEVSAGVICAEGRFLITQRRPAGHLALLWEFPGGKREPQESWEECLRREMLEELGVDVTVGAWLDAVTHEYEDRDIHLRFFRCALDRGTPVALDCHDLRWVRPRDLADFAFPPADAELVRWLATSAAALADSARVTFAPGPALPGARVDVPRGTRLEEAAARSGIRPRSGCGIGECGACAVVVAAGAANLTPRTMEERVYFALEARHALPGADAHPRLRPTNPHRRLACQARVAGDVTLAFEESALLHF